MRKVVVYTLLSVDGVGEAPEEYFFDFDDEMLANLTAVITAQDTVLLGRTQYDEWLRYWPTAHEQPFADFINSVTKYVATSRPLGDDPWTNAHAIDGSVEDFVRELKSGDGGDIGVHGSLTLGRVTARRGAGRRAPPRGGTVRGRHRAEVLRRSGRAPTAHPGGELE